MRETRDLWNAWSDDFQAAWNAETAEGELPPAPVHYGPGFPEDERFAVLPSLDGAEVVELGCGGGQATVGFARRDVAAAVGVDLSIEQLRHARRLRDRYGVDASFVVGDVRSLPLRADRFDLAFSSWVFQMVPDLDAAFGEAARILRPGGALVFAVPHPFYELFDPDTGEPDRSYFDSEPERRSVGGRDAELTIHHHAVGEYHDALVDAGFTVERLLEPGTADPDDYREQWRHRPELMATIPPTLAFRAVLG
jgi:SAM-dependent methyltransferase